MQTHRARSLRRPTARLHLAAMSAVLGVSSIAPAAIPTNVLVVDGSLSGGPQNGSSWGTAFTHLNDALAAANASPGIDEIWIRGCDASGTPHPDHVQYADESNLHPTGTNSRDDSFVVPSGIIVYGGFRGIESTLEERDPEGCPTILSGEIGDTTTRADNAYTVVFGDRDDGTGTRGLHGLIVEDGEANGTGGGLGEYDDATYRQGVAGAAIFETGGFAARSTFRRNRAQAGGVTISTLLTSSDIIGVAIEMRACTFHENEALSTAGARFILPGTAVDTTLRGGGVIAGGGRVDSAVLLSNCLAYENTSAAEGGVVAIRNDGGMEIRGSTLVANESFGGPGGAIYVLEDPVADPVESILCVNSVLWDNVANGFRGTSLFEDQIGLDLASPSSLSTTIEHSIIEGVFSTMDFAADNLDQDPEFRDAASFDYRLESTSPGIDYGDNTEALTDHRDVDDDGDMLTEKEPDRAIVIRVIGSVIDTGAFEYCTVAHLDLNDDENVGFDELLAVLTAWGPCDPPPSPCPEDFNGNGHVDFADVLELLAAWGWCGAFAAPPGSVGDCIDRLGTSDPASLAACIEAMMMLEASE